MTRTTSTESSLTRANAETSGAERRTSGDTRHLEWHGGDGGQWRIVVYVPRHLRTTVGKAALRRGLKTQDLRIAQGRRWPVVAEFKKLIANAEAKLAGRPIDPVLEEALGDKEVRDILATVAKVTLHPSDADMLAEFEHDILPNHVKRVAAEHGAQKAREYEAIARGERTPLAVHLDRWIKETPHISRRTHGDYRRAVKRLAEFATTAGWNCAVETFDRRAAGYFAWPCPISWCNCGSGDMAG